MGHESKCSHLHGHNYNVEITAQTYGHLDEIGRVVDFSVIKQVYDPWIQKNFDHGFILNWQDKSAKDALLHFTEHTKEVVQKVYLMHENPTAENIAKFLGTYDEFVQALAQYKVKVIKVVVHETDNCFASWEG